MMNLKHTLSAADSRASIRRLRRALILFAVLLLLPMSLVFAKAYQQIQDETFLNYRNAADSLLSRINKRLDDIIATEERRAFSEYNFVQTASDPSTPPLPSNSPLTNYPLQSGVAGIVGYFQINPRGALESPLLPPATSVDPGYKFQPRLLTQPYERQQLFSQVKAKLAAAGVYPAGAAKRMQSIEDHPAKNARKAFEQRDETQDGLAGAQTAQQSISSLNLDNSQLDRYERINKVFENKYTQTGGALRQKLKQREPEPAKGEADDKELAASSIGEGSAPEAEAKPSRAVGIAESDLATEATEVDPLQLIADDDLTFIFQRKVWRNSSRYIQGFVVDGGRFLQEVLREIRGDRGLESDLSLVVSESDRALLEVAPANSDDDIALLKSSYYRAQKAAVVVVKGRLAAPFDSFELLAALPNGLPPSPSFSVVVMLGAAILSTLAVGLVVIYRMSLSRIHLAQKKSDFVSAVSHELRTPLTSIRMYAEMLREGWVQDEEKKRSYYNFIFTESERLSRLIANVLQLSKIAQGDRELPLKRVKVRDAVELLAAKVKSQTDAAGFSVDLALPKDEESSDVSIAIEEDAFVQIGINLVDNALKFSRTAAEKRLQLGARLCSGGKPEVVIFIRDFGAGVPAHEQRRIFELFYRVESELTRETPGTGIGLALVKDLASQMDARVDMRNESPGAEFQIIFRALES